jgi:hypothetical protein
MRSLAQRLRSGGNSDRFLDASSDIGVLTKRNYATGKRVWTSGSEWHAADATFYPSDQRVFVGDLGPLIRDYIVPGHVPPAPVLGLDDEVITLGSCFARELRAFLGEAGLAARRFRVPEGLNNTYALADFFSWCVTGAETGRGFRYDRLASGEIAEWAPESERQVYREAFAEAGAFVFTIGLAEVWEDRETGGVFWRGVPKSIFEAGRHVSRLTTVEENLANMRRLTELVREVNEHAPVVFTLSPVPLQATFRGISCMTADCVSKSVLRVAVDQLMSDRRDGVYYWPSFEVVRWAGAHYDYRAYGFHDNKPRHVTRYLVGQIIDAFIESYYRPEAVASMRGRRAGGHGTIPPPTTLTGKLSALRTRREKRRRGKKSSASDD